MAIIIATAPRTGSMWVYNVAREILKKSGIVPLPEEIEVNYDAALLKRAIFTNVKPPELYCIKTHMALNLDLKNIRVITLHRDIRESMLSYMRFMKITDFNQGLESAKGIANITNYYCLSQKKNVCVLTYEDIVKNSAKVVHSIATFFGLRLHHSDIEEIVATFSIARVRKIINKLNRAQANLMKKDDIEKMDSDYYVLKNEINTGIRVIDKKTCFQSYHITSTNEKEWVSFFTEEQKQAITEQFGEWLLTYGYEI